MSLSKKSVVLGFYGSTLDAGQSPRRWERWRPTVSLFQQSDLWVDELHLLHDPRFARSMKVLVEDIRRLSPHTTVVLVPFPLNDAWDFSEVYGALHDYARQADYNPDQVDLLIHITPGSHVAQICLFLLTEARFLPGRLLQTAPPRKDDPEARWAVIDLDLARYDALAQRLQAVQQEGTDYLKAGIETKNEDFNTLIDQIEKVALRSTAPMLLTGPTGAGKTRLARRIYDLRRRRGALDGVMVEVNCATLRGDQAMATLFGHVRGAFTGAIGEREGLLRQAHGGLLFLDEIAELGLDEQAMLLRAIEEHRFLPVGSDTEVQVSFQLLAGTHADLRERVQQGRFREDLLARIDLWHFVLPGLAKRPEDVGPNLEHELRTYAESTGQKIRMNVDAKARFLRFAKAPKSLWSGNFRDLHAAVQRMATLAEGGRIRVDDVDQEIERLQKGWGQSTHDDLAVAVLGERAVELDRFDRVQLVDVLAVCLESKTISEAGRRLFAQSRSRRRSVNDADRLRKYLARFDLSFDTVHRDAPQRGEAHGDRHRSHTCEV